MMRPLRYLIVSFALLQAAGLAAAGALEGDWVSYRDAYRAMVVFDKYGGAKNLIQNQVQVLPRQEDAASGPVRLTLDGKTTHLKLSLDATGRAVFPLLKAAYDENAVLAIDGKHSQFALRPRVSVMVRADGVYDTAELHAACEQALGYARHVDASARGRQCAGVRFVFDKAATGTLVRLRRAGTAAAAMQAVDGPAFTGEADAAFSTVTYRFDGAEHTQVLTTVAPLAITPLFE
jgi:hypothetical protein